MVQVLDLESALALVLSRLTVVLVCWHGCVPGFGCDCSRSGVVVVLALVVVGTVAVRTVVVLVVALLMLVVEIRIWTR